MIHMNCYDGVKIEDLIAEMRWLFGLSRDDTWAGLVVR